MLNEVRPVGSRVFLWADTMNEKGLQSLRRYFELIVFQSYLQSTRPDTMRNFQTIETYVDNLPGAATS